MIVEDETRAVAADARRTRRACGREPVDARIEKGRTPTHALGRLWAVEQFDRVIAPAPTTSANGSGRGGFTPKDLTWILGNAPAETLVLKPAPAEADALSTSANHGQAIRRPHVAAQT